MTKKKNIDGQWSDLTLLWDADGTIMYSHDWWEHSLYLTAEHFGFTIPEGPELKKSFAGIQLREIYKKVALEGVDIEECFEFHAARQAETMHLITLFDGEYETLKTFDGLGIKQGIVTARTLRTPLIQSLESLEILDFFKCIVCMEDVSLPKPDPEGIRLCMRSLKGKKKNTFMIGDTKHDINAGKNAGIKTIGVLFGYEKEDEEFLSAGADFYVTEFAQIADIVLEKTKTRK